MPPTSALPSVIGALHVLPLKCTICPPVQPSHTSDDELPQIADYIAAIARAGADAVIVQDLGLARLVKLL